MIKDYFQSFEKADKLHTGLLIVNIFFTLSSFYFSGKFNFTFPEKWFVFIIISIGILIFLISRAFRIRSFTLSYETIRKKFIYLSFIRMFLVTANVIVISFSYLIYPKFIYPLSSMILIIYLLINRINKDILEKEFKISIEKKGD